MPLGGLGEVGMNAMVFDFGGTAIPVDAGILFAEPNDFGIEAVYADYEQLLVERRPPVWLITHAHEDHIGAVSSILEICARRGLEPPRILGPRLALALVKARLSDDVRHVEAKRFIDRLVPIETGHREQVGDVDIRFLETRHSTLETFSIAFEWASPSGPLSIVHTSDFKIDPSKFEDGSWGLEKVYGTFGGESPDFLFVDSTNAERPGHSVSESQILPGLEKLVREAPGRVFVTLFASNVQRVANLAQMAAKSNRVLGLAGRSLETAHRISLELGLYGTKCADLPPAIVRATSEMAHLAPGKQLILCSGSQGEGRSVLMKMSMGTHPEFALRPDDTIIFSSKLIPGNERAVSRLLNGLLKSGARVIWGDEAKVEAGGPIHASGHARAGEIEALMRFLKPRNVVPVHGEYRQLRACADIAKRAGPSWSLNPDHVHITENHTELSFERDHAGWTLVDRHLPDELVQRRLRFDTFSALSRDPFLRVRKRAAEGGVVTVAMGASGRVELSIDGVRPENDPVIEALSAEIDAWARRTARRLTNRDYGNPSNALKAELADDLSRLVRKRTGDRPYVSVLLLGS